MGWPSRGAASVATPSLWRASVVAAGTGESREDMGAAYRSCVHYIGEANPDRFPTGEEYEEAKRRYPQPLWSDELSAMLAYEEGTSDEEYEASWIT